MARKIKGGAQGGIPRRRMLKGAAGIAGQSGGAGGIIFAGRWFSTPQFLGAE